MNIHKALGILIVGASIGGSQLAGAPLNESYVAKEAKWLAHVDVDALKESVLGKIAVGHAKEEIARENDSKISIDVDMVLEELKSITAYGTDFEHDKNIDGVLVLKTGKKLPAILDGFLASQEYMRELDEDAGLEVRLLDDKPYTTYLFGDELYVSNPEEGLLLASKRFEQIEKAFAVVKGEADNLSKSKTELILNNDSGFFLVAATGGLGHLENLPPQARLLQKATGVQFSIGESNGEARMNVVLGAADEKVSRQLSRIVEGIFALVSFMNIEDQGLADLVSGIDVQQTELAVSIDLSYPVSELTNLINLMNGHGHHGHEDHNE